MASESLLQRLLAEDSFEHETFRDLDLDQAQLGGKELYRCTFENCRLQESGWKNSRLEDCVVKGSDLTRATFSGTGLRGVRFEGCKLMGVDWSAVAPHPELAFEGCDLRYASFVGLSLRRTPLLRCTAHEANFLDSDLSECDFAGTDLRGATLRGCTLTATDFSAATGLFLEPARNRLKDTRVAVEAAVLLAEAQGMRVAGYSAEPKRSGKRGRS